MSFVHVLIHTKSEGILGLEIKKKKFPPGTKLHDKEINHLTRGENLRLVISS